MKDGKSKTRQLTDTGQLIRSIMSMPEYEHRIKKSMALFVIGGRARGENPTEHDARRYGFNIWVNDMQSVGYDIEEIKRQSTVPKMFWLYVGSGDSFVSFRLTLPVPNEPGKAFMI